MRKLFLTLTLHIANKAASLAAGVGSDGRYKGTDTGFAAANTALKHQTSQPQYGVSEDGRKKALLAATMSINRGKAKHSPIGTPPLSSKAIQATRVKRLNMPAEMFTEHPPVEIEKEYERYQAALHASAISMAKQLYKLEQNKAAVRVQKLHKMCSFTFQIIADNVQDSCRRQAYLSRFERSCATAGS